MKKISTLLMLFCLSFGMAWAQTTYKPGARTTTLEAGKKYFIGAATFYNDARYNLLYNNAGDLTYSETSPSALITDETYLFTVEEVGENNTYYVKNSDGKYLLFDNKTSTETKTAITVVPYASVKGSITCGNDVQACNESGSKIEYNAITNETPVVCVYNGTDAKGWRHISGLEFGRPTPFAFYEVEETSLLPEVTTDVDAPKLYTIKNIRANKYATYNGATQSMSLQSTVENVNGLFYFTAGEEGTYKIHNLATNNKCTSHNSWTDEGIDWYIQKSGNTKYTGVAISSQNDLTDDKYSWNDYQGNATSVNYWNGNDDGSVWLITEFEGDISELGLKMSTANAENLYFIKNVRSGKYANFVAKGTQFTQETNTGYGSYWYFVEKTDAENVPAGYKACYIYNAAYNLGVENPSNGNMAALDDGYYPTKLYYVRTYEKDNKWGYVMYDPQDNNGWNDQNSSTVTNYSYDDAGSIWSLIPANKTAAQLKTEATDAKNTAVKYISAAEEADFYTHSAEAVATAKTAIEGVDVSTLDGAVSSLLNGTISTPMATLQATEKSTTAPAAGQYIQLKNRLYNKYLKATDTGLTSVVDSKDVATWWCVEEGDGDYVKLSNASTGKYIGEIRQSAAVAMVEEASAKQFAFTNQTEVYGVFQETTGATFAYAHINGSNVLVGWSKDAEASQWIISEVTVDDALEDLQALYDEVDNAFGDKVGQYEEMVADPEDVLYLSLNQAKEALESTGEKDVWMLSSIVSSLQTNWDAFKADPSTRQINLPTSGKFLRIKNDNATGYLNSGTGTGLTQFAADVAESASSIFYLDGEKLLSYTTGKYLANGDNFVHYTNTVGANAGTTFGFAQAPAFGKMVISFKGNNGDRSFYSNGVGNSNAASSGQTGQYYRFTVEEVTSLPVTITAAGYASFYAPVAVEIAEGLTAYYVSSVEGEWAKFTEIEGTIPANTGVLLAGAEGSYDLTIAENAEEIEGTNLLEGTVASAYITDDAYALGYVDDEVGFYTAKMTDGQWLNNGFKAYLPKASGASLVLRFNFGGNTTAIESVVAPVFDANAPIYDLSGRRVLNAVKGGLYIQNGKKFIVK